MRYVHDVTPWVLTEQQTNLASSLLIWAYPGKHSWSYAIVLVFQPVSSVLEKCPSNRLLLLHSTKYNTRYNTSLTFGRLVLTVSETSSPVRLTVFPLFVSSISCCPREESTAVWTCTISLRIHFSEAYPPPHSHLACLDSFRRQKVKQSMYSIGYGTTNAYGSVH